MLRPKLIVVEAFDEAGNKFRLKCDGLLARVIQHEYDHLNGVEFTEKVSDYSKLVGSDYYKENIRNSNAQLEASLITVKEYSQV